MDTTVEISDEDAFASIQEAVMRGDFDVNGCNEHGITPLIHAVGKAQLDVVRYLLEQGADANKPACGWISVAIAAQTGNIEVAPVLLEHGADVDATEYYTRETALHLASTVEMVKFLIDTAGADLTAADSIGRKPIHAAIMRRNLDVADEFLLRGVDLNEQVDGSPLVNDLIANDFDFDDCVEWLVSKGADLNSLDKEGRTALDQALIRKAHKLSDLLLRNGAVTSQKNEESARPFVRDTMTRDDAQMIEMLLERGIVNMAVLHYNILHLAIEYGAAEIVTSLVALGADVNAVDENGNPPLLLTVRYRHPEMMKQLVDNGADVNIPNTIGETVLHEAVKYGFMDSALWLIEQGADVNAVDSMGNTILHFWIGTSDVEATKTLFDTIVNVNLANENGRTALHTAAQTGSIPMAEWLVEMGADVNAQDVEGLRSLHLAAGALRTPMVSWLLEHGADMHIQTRNPVQFCLLSFTPSPLVVRTYNTLRLLCSHGAVWDPSKIESFCIEADLGEEVFERLAPWRKGMLACLEVWGEQHKTTESSLMEIPPDVLSASGVGVMSYVESYQKLMKAPSVKIEDPSADSAA